MLYSYHILKSNKSYKPVHMPEIYLLGGHMKDMKDRVRRAILAAGEHWRMRQVLLLVMVAVTVLGMVTVSRVQPRRVYVVLTADGGTEIISAVPAGA